MAFSFTPRRRHNPELMDAPGLPESELADAYLVLRTVNRQFFGARRPLARELELFLGPGRPIGHRVRVLDVGSGSGDLARTAADFLEGRGTQAHAVALDRDPTATALAVGQRLDVVRGDAMRLPFADRAMDLVTAIKFAHHFHSGALCLLVAEMARVANHRVIVLDIRRHWLAYFGFAAWSRVFTRNRLVRHDGPLSVLRGFTGPELSELAPASAEFSWVVRSYAGFQLALVGIRTEQG